MTTIQAPSNPMQPFILDEPVVRFKGNKIVEALLEFARKGRQVDLNDIACMDFSQDDRCQFAQLIGYSLSGYHELSYVSDDHAKAATKAAKKLFPDCGGCRDDGCELHSGVEKEIL